MKTPFFSYPPNEQIDEERAWSHRHLGDQNFQQVGGFLAWWHRLTAPPAPAAGASFRERDLARRGRTASTILLCLAIILPSVGFIGLVGPNKQIFLTALVVEFIIFGCCWLNRKGHVNWAGIILSASVNFGMYLSLLRAPGGVSVEDKDIFYLLIFSELIIGAILPATWILVAVIGNGLFAFFMITFGPHTAGLDAMLASSYWTIVLRLIQIHSIPASIVWSLALLAQELTKRADRAEEVARLQYTIAEMKDEQAQTASHLEHHIEQIILTLNQVGQGNLDARVMPHNQHTTLWPLVGSMNNLLSRYQSSRHAERQAQIVQLAYQQLNEEIILVNTSLQKALYEQQPFSLPVEVKQVEPLFKHLHGKYLLHPSETRPMR